MLPEVSTAITGGGVRYSSGWGGKYLVTGSYCLRCPGVVIPGGAFQKLPKQVLRRGRGGLRIVLTSRSKKPGRLPHAAACCAAWLSGNFPVGFFLGYLCRGQGGAGVRVRGVSYFTAAAAGLFCRVAAAAVRGRGRRGSGLGRGVLGCCPGVCPWPGCGGCPLLRCSGLLQLRLLSGLRAGLGALFFPLPMAV